MSRSSVGIVGGGILGMTAAYRLAQAGVHVALYERSEDLGGLTGSFDFGGRKVDRFYHIVLPTDDRVRGLAEEVGLGDRFRFRPTGVGFYDDGRLFSMTSARELLTFPLLSLPDRLRLGAFAARCRIGRGEGLDDVPLLDWLRRQCGSEALERMWKPLLDSKFDGRYDDLPATYIWARTRRASHRDRSGREVMGWLEGGYETLVQTLARRIRELGGEVHPGIGVDRIEGSAEGVEGLVVDGQLRRFDSVLCTLLPPQARGLLSPALAAIAPADHCRYLGVVCVLLRTSRSVCPYYTLNITDRRVPLTTVVETTHVVDPARVGGTLLYVTKYCNPGNPDLTRDPGDVTRDYVAHLRRMFPIGDEEILDATVQSAQAVEPVHTLHARARIPDMHPVSGLTLCSAAHVYPETVNGQSVIGVAQQAVAGMVERLGRAPAAASAA